MTRFAGIDPKCMASSTYNPCLELVVYLEPGCEHRANTTKRRKP